MEVTRLEFEAVMQLDAHLDGSLEHADEEWQRHMQPFSNRIGRFRKKFLNAEAEQKYKITKKAKMLRDALEIANILESSLADAYPYLKRKAIKFIRNYGK